MNLTSKDILELTRATKSGKLELCNVSRFAYLIDGFNPKKPITEADHQNHLEQLREFGYIPTSQETIKEYLLKELDEELLTRWMNWIENGQLYFRMCENILYGLIAMAALGGKVTIKEFTDEAINGPSDTL